MTRRFARDATQCRTHSHAAAAIDLRRRNEFAAGPIFGRRRRRLHLKRTMTNHTNCKYFARSTSRQHPPTLAGVGAGASFSDAPTTSGRRRVMRRTVRQAAPLAGSAVRRAAAHAPHVARPRGGGGGGQLGNKDQKLVFSVFAKVRRTKSNCSRPTSG